MTLAGLLLVVVVVAVLAITYHKHMQAIWEDIAIEEADELFDSYVKHCEYRIHTELHTLIVDETK